MWESIILLFPHPACKAYPIAILLHGHCAIYAPPQAPLLDAIYHTILVMAISCKGQAVVCVHITTARGGRVAGRGRVIINVSEVWEVNRSTRHTHTYIDRAVSEVWEVKGEQGCVGLVGGHSWSCPRCVSGVGLGLYTILLLPILYGIWHTKGRSDGGSYTAQ